MAILLAWAGGGCTDGASGVCGTDDPIELSQVSAFWLPINSERFGVSGRVDEADMCVGLSWDFSTLSETSDDYCLDFMMLPARAVVRPAVDGACGDVWAYQPNADVVYVGGCARPDPDGPLHQVTVTAQVDSPLFSGTVSFHTP